MWRIRSERKRNEVTFILVRIPCGVVVWKVGIPHDGDGRARRSGVYLDRQGIHSFHESFRCVEKGPLYALLGDEGPDDLLDCNISKRDTTLLPGRSGSHWATVSTVHHFKLFFELFSFFHFIPLSISLTHVHRCIGSRNATRQTLPASAKLTYLSMYDNRNGKTQCIRDV
jgi:hypothetical protein